MSKKKKNVVRCVVCGLTATKKISVEPVCDCIACNVYVEGWIKSLVMQEKNKK